MIEKEISLVKRKVYLETLDNGLEVYLFPNDDLDDYYITYFTKYGGMDLSFIDKNGKKRDSNPGIAHFLEHKLFESEGESPFEFFAKSGSDVNAYTDYRQTAYILSGNKDFLTNLDFVINYVNNLYLTLENVEKEKGIIAEELKMYEDMPEWQINDIQTKMLFSKSNILHDVGGKVSDIMKITKEELEACYDIFYQPSNMKLVISGKIGVEETIALIKANKKLMAKQNVFPIERIEPKEPHEVVLKEKSVNIPAINSPRMYYVLKMSDVDDTYKNNMIARMFNNILFGKTSSFIEEEEGKSFNIFYAVTAVAAGHYITEIMSNPRDVPALIKKVNDTIKNEIITKDDLARSKKTETALILATYEQNESLCRDLSHDLIDKELLLDPESLIDSISLSDMEEYRKKIDLDNYSLLKINY